MKSGPLERAAFVVGQTFNSIADEAHPIAKNAIEWGIRRNDYIVRDPQMEANADALAARTLGTAAVRAFLARAVVLTRGQTGDARQRLELLQ